MASSNARNMKVLTEGRFTIGPPFQKPHHAAECISKRNLLVKLYETLDEGPEGQSLACSNSCHRLSGSTWKATLDQQEFRDTPTTGDGRLDRMSKIKLQSAMTTLSCLRCNCMLVSIYMGLRHACGDCFTLLPQLKACLKSFAAAGRSPTKQRKLPRRLLFGRLCFRIRTPPSGWGLLRPAPPGAAERLLLGGFAP